MLTRAPPATRSPAPTVALIGASPARINVTVSPTATPVPMMSTLTVTGAPTMTGSVGVVNVVVLAARVTVSSIVSDSAVRAASTQTTRMSCVASASVAGTVKVTSPSTGVAVAAAAPSISSVAVPVETGPAALLTRARTSRRAP